MIDFSPEVTVAGCILVCKVRMMFWGCCFFFLLLYVNNININPDKISQNSPCLFITVLFCFGGVFSNPCISRDFIQINIDCPV